MASDLLIEMRSTIKGMLEELSGSDNDTAFAAFEAKHGDMLDKADRDLRRLGFIKLLNDVGGRSRKASAQTKQSELFPDLRNPQMIAVPIYTNGKLTGRKKVEFNKATLAEIQAWRALTLSHRRKRPDQFEPIDTALGEILKHTSDTSLTFDDALKLLDGQRADGTNGA